MYVSPNFTTKKQLKDAVNNHSLGGVMAPITVFSPGPFPCPENGVVAVEGPHYPMPHRWYAQVEVKDSVVVKVLS